MMKASWFSSLPDKISFKADSSSQILNFIGKLSIFDDTFVEQDVQDLHEKEIQDGEESTQNLKFKESLQQNIDAQSYE